MNPRWLLNRLRCMSAAEVGHRLLRAAWPQRAWRPVPAHGDGVLFARAGAPMLCSAERAALLADAHAIADGSVPLFAGARTSIPMPPRWNAALDPHDIKYTWELNRHLHLVRLAQAYAVTGDDSWRFSLHLHLDTWLEQCPPGHGPNWRSGLELANRLVSWGLIWQLLGGAIEPALRQSWLPSIHAHCTAIAARLSRHSSANNHLIGELAGLYLGSCIWPCWPAAARWRSQARAELEQQIALQFTSDGVHREQAFAYQLFCLEFLLLAGQLGQCTGQPFSPGYWEALRRALHFTLCAAPVAQAVGDADDGRVWNLDAGGACRVAQLAALCAAPGASVPSHPGARWLRHLFPAAPPAVPPLLPAPSHWAFPEGGYLLFGHPGHIYGMVDTGPLGYLGIAAHGHADALALTLQVLGEPFLVDAGTFSYWCERRWRDYFRGTAAHNTLRVDGLDQSLGGGRFLWLRKARARIERMPRAPGQFDLCVSHDGYRRLPDPVRHRRSVRFDATAGTLIVRDRVRGRTAHLAEQFWHIAPHLTLARSADGATVSARHWRAEFAISGAEHIDIVRGADHPPLGWISRAYGSKAPCPVLRVSTQSSDVQIVCRITITFF